MKYNDKTIYLTNKIRPYDEIAEFIVKPESDKIRDVIVGSVLGVFIGCLILMIGMMLWSYSLSYRYSYLLTDRKVTDTEQRKGFRTLKSQVI